MFFFFFSPSYVVPPLERAVLLNFENCYKRL